MRKGNLLVLTIPAMLLAASCGTGTYQKASIATKSSNEDEEAMVNIVCRNCLVKYNDKTSSVFMDKLPISSTPTTFEIVRDEEHPDFIIPGETEFRQIVDFRRDGKVSTDFTYSLTGDARALFSFVVDQPISVVIDTTPECMSFKVDIKDQPEVGFDFNGLINYVDWGDDVKDSMNEHKYNPGTYTVKVYGNLSSVWFAKEGNNGLLKGGNAGITEFNINRSVKTLPNYALNGCNSLSKVYIGNSVKTIGKKAFYQASDTILNNKEIISCYATSKPVGWDEEWTNCPVCYGMKNSYDKAEKFVDEKTNLEFTVINIENANEVTSAAMITKPDKIGESITSLQIPTSVSDGKNQYSVHSIAPFAFADFGFVSSVTLSFAEDNKVTEIGDYAFFRQNISSIELNNIRTISPFRIGRRSFYGSAVSDIFFPHYTEDYEGKAPNFIIDDEAFYETQVKSIVIPSDSFKLTEIHKEAFSRCYALSTFICESNNNFPASVTTIGDMAFAYCRELLSSKGANIVLITNTVEKMGEKVFFDAYNDSSIRVAYEEGKTPEGWSKDWDIIDDKGAGNRLIVSWGFVKEITTEDGCVYSITKNGKTETAELTRYNPKKGVSMVTIPEQLPDGDKHYEVVAIGKNVFNGVRSITSVIVPKTVTKVGYHAFASGSPFLKVLYGGSDKEVASGWDPEWTFPNISTSDVGAALYTNYAGTVSQSELSNSQFDLVKEETPKNDTYNASILQYHSDLKEVVIPGTITDSTSNTYNITSIGGKSFINPEDPRVGVDLSNGFSFAADNKLTSIGTGAFISAKFPSAPLVLPDGIKSIGCGVFAKTSGVTSIDLGKQLTSVPLGAFAMSSDLTTVTLPETATKVGEYAFYGCEALTAVDLTKAIGMESIPEALFDGCSSYKGELDANGQPTGNLQLPTTIKSIERNAFTLSGVEKVVLSNSTNLGAIGESAFAGCDSLTSVALPSNCKELGPNLFGIQKESGKNCAKLSEIDLTAINECIKVPENLLGGVDFLPDAFKTGRDGKIYVPSELVDAYKSQWEFVLGTGNLDHIQAKA